MYSRKHVSLDLRINIKKCIPIGVNLYKAPRPEPPPHFLKSKALRAFEPPHFLSDTIYFLPTMKLSSTV